jgi:cell division protein FtsW (lipid II flippase)
MNTDAGVRPRGWAAFLLFAIPSGLAVAAGCLAVYLNNGSVGQPARNAGAWLVGALLFPLVSRLGSKASLAILILAPIGLLATFVDPGLSGVHRWITLGPLRLNIAAILAPAALVVLAAREGRNLLRWACAAICMLVLALQPDASQATAFGASLIVMLAFERGSVPMRLAAGALIAVCVVVAWLRPDPLAPVAEVEGVIDLAFRASWALGGAALIALAAASIAPALLARKTAPSAAGVALGVYFLAAAVAPGLGYYPVPLVGMSVSPIIGYWLAAATLAGRRGNRQTTPTAEG